MGIDDSSNDYLRAAGGKRLTNTIHNNPDEEQVQQSKIFEDIGEQNKLEDAHHSHIAITKTSTRSTTAQIKRIHTLPTLPHPAKPEFRRDRETVVLKRPQLVVFVVIVLAFDH